MTIRISAPQKRALLEIHFTELRNGLNVAVATSHLRLVTEKHLDKSIKKHHFLAGLCTLSERGFLTSKKNTNRQVCATARSNENMWTLTEEGRAYAETLHSALLRRKRSYTKSKRLKRSYKAPH